MANFSSSANRVTKRKHMHSSYIGNQTVHTGLPESRYNPCKTCRTLQSRESDGWWHEEYSIVFSTDGAHGYEEEHKVMQLAGDANLMTLSTYLWFIQKCSQDMPVSEPVLCQKAIQLYEKLDERSVFLALVLVGVGFGDFALDMKLGNF